MTLEARLNKIISEQKISKREFAKRVGMSENYLYILTSNSRPGTNQNKTISPQKQNCVVYYERTRVTRFTQASKFPILEMPCGSYYLHFEESYTVVIVFLD